MVVVVKFIYFEKAKKFCYRFDWHYIEQIYGGDFAKFCGLLRIYELLVGQYCGHFERLKYVSHFVF